jgi:hypothetical protein
MKMWWFSQFRWLKDPTLGKTNDTPQAELEKDKKEVARAKKVGFFQAGLGCSQNRSMISRVHPHEKFP